MGVVEHHVDAVRAGARRAVEVHLHRAFVGIDGERAFQQDFLAARNVEPALAVIGAGFQLADRLPRRRFRARDDLFGQFVDVVESVAVAQQLQPLRADAAGRDLRRDITQHLVRGADVVADDVEQQLVPDALLVELGARDPQAFLVHVARAGADAVAADIRVMDGRAEEADHLALAEHRRDDGDVEEVAGRQPRVVGDKDIALVERVRRELVDKMRAGGRQRVDVAGRASNRLRDHAPLAVQERTGEVARLAHDGAEGDALQRAGLLARRADQVAP